MENNSYKLNRFTAVMVAIVSPLVKLLFRIKIEGKENLPQNGGYVFCSNHVSLLDPVFWIVKLRKQICYMAKAEIFKNKLSGWFFRKIEAFPVDRQGGSAGSVSHAIDVVKNGKILGVFPEGTRSKDGKIGRAKSGAAYIANMTGADVLPMAIVVKNGKVRPFCKIKLIIGKPIPHSEIHFDGTDKRGLRNASSRIMGDITALWERGQNELSN